MIQKLKRLWVHTTCRRRKRCTTSTCCCCNLEKKNHYIWIKDMSRLIREQQTSHCSKIFICNKCLQHFYSTEKLKSHENDCSKIVTKMVSPEKSTVEYRHFERQIDVPFVVYAEFECLFQDIQSCQPDPASA
ncbi:uncharacterized protein LOC119659033 [Hermetia illucens]|uniref:uncharacterized protein LOC119659033 n=1 Tax=Hermetia illucens TaxID=343691 RepID=UPI0018CC4E0D|nr:uncharacterized protein LOC119659033 [Hermetia illucens]